MHRQSWLRRSRVAAFAILVLQATAMAPAASAMPVISELFYDAVGSDDGRSFVELYGTPGAPLDGLRLESINGDGGTVAARLVLTGVFGADGLFVVADRTSSGTTLVPDADLLLEFDLQNGPDSLVLRSATDVLDAVAYGVFDLDQLAAGEGAPAIDAAAGASLARRFANVDTNDNALDFLELAAPTPGSAPLAPIPEPGTAGLAAIGLAAIARGRCGRAQRAGD